jgi:hypothetical protein
MRQLAAAAAKGDLVKAYQLAWPGVTDGRGEKAADDGGAEESDMAMRPAW